MDKSTLKALKRSIQKWHDICYHEAEDLSADNCPLCQHFVDEDGWTKCTIGCPVYLKTKKDSCHGSPYIKWTKLCFDQPYDPFAKDNWKATTPKKVEAAEAELKFLVCLLPEGEKAKMKDGDVWYWEWE